MIFHVSSSSNTKICAFNKIKYFIEKYGNIQVVHIFFVQVFISFLENNEYTYISRSLRLRSSTPFRSEPRNSIVIINCESNLISKKIGKQRAEEKRLERSNGRRIVAKRRQTE